MHFSDKSNRQELVSTGVIGDTGGHVDQPSVNSTEG
jgi:hypothetical protein